MANVTVSIKAETKQYQQAMQQAAAEMKKLTSEHSLAAAQAKLSGSAQDGLKAKVTELTQKIDLQRDTLGKQKTHYDNLKTTLEQQKTVHDQLKTKVDAAKKAYEESAKATGEDSEETKKLKAEYEKLQGQLNTSEAQIGKTETAITRQEAAVTQTTAQLANMEAELRDVNAELARAPFDEYAQKAEKVGGTLTKAGQALLPISTAVAGLGAAAVKTTMDFDSEMSKVSAISGATGKDFEALRDKAREMGSKTKFSATEAGQAMEYMAMAGWKTDDMLDGIDGVMNLAAASGENLATTSDIVTDALTAFGLGAKDSGHFADILAAASTNANTNVSMMGETFKYAAPICGSMGYSAEDAAVAIGLMANAGIKSSQAGTSLRGALTNLAKPTDAVQAAMEKYGISLTDSEGNMLSLHQLMLQLRQNLGGLTEAEQTQAAATLFGKNAMSGMLAIINGSDADFEKLTNAIANCDGSSEAMAATMQDNLQGQLTILMSQLQELAISFGDLLMPKIREIVKHIQNFVDKLNKMDEGTKKTILNVGLFTAALAPVLLGLGKFITFTADVSKGLGTLAEGLSKAGGLSGVFSKALGFITSPAGIAVAAIAGITAVVVTLWNTNEGFRNAVTAIWTKIKTAFETFTSGITERINALGFNFQNITQVISAAWSGFCNLLAPVLEGAFATVANALQTAFNVILGIWDVFSNLFSGNWSGAWEAAKGIFTSVFNGIKEFFSTILSTIKGVVNVFLSWFGTNWTEVWNGISSFFTGIWNGITSFLSGVWETIKNVVTVGCAAIGEIFNAAVQIITLPFQLIWENCKTILTTAWEAIKTAIQQALDFIKDKIITPVWNAIKTVTSTAWNGIKSAVSTVVNAVSSTVSSVWNAIKTTTSSVWNGIKSTTTSVWNAVKSALTTPINAAKTAVSTAINSIKTAMSTAWNAIKSTATSTWNAIKNAIMTPINAAKTAVQNAINAIKAKFNFSWSLPKLKLPHPQITGSFSLNPPSVPHFSIAWYKSGGIMTDPTVFGMAGNTLLAGGEDGAEAILPLKQFYDRLGDMLDRKLDALAAGTNVFVYVTMDGDVVASRVFTRVEDRIVREYQRRR